MLVFAKQQDKCQHCHCAGQKKVHMPRPIILTIVDGNIRYRSVVLTVDPTNLLIKIRFMCDNNLSQITLTMGLIIDLS